MNSADSENSDALQKSGVALEAVSCAIMDRGYVILHNMFTVTEIDLLYTSISGKSEKMLHTAGVGRDTDFRQNRLVRSDSIHWLGENDQEADFYLAWMEQLRLHLNRELFLGLFDYECHYAHYPEGALYKRHIDTFRGMSNRRLTTILYLNPDWKMEDGGELVMYHGDSEDVLETVLPVAGTMVIFLSEMFPHEVLPARKSRYSLTGWFRVNSNTMTRLDPPS